MEASSSDINRETASDSEKEELKAPLPGSDTIDNEQLEEAVDSLVRISENFVQFTNDIRATADRFSREVKKFCRTGNDGGKGRQETTSASSTLHDKILEDSDRIVNRATECIQQLSICAQQAADRANIVVKMAREAPEDTGNDEHYSEFSSALNQRISDFFSSIKPVADSVEQATVDLNDVFRHATLVGDIVLEMVRDIFIEKDKEPLTESGISNLLWLQAFIMRQLVDDSITQKFADWLADYRASDRQNEAEASCETAEDMVKDRQESPLPESDILTGKIVDRFRSMKSVAVIADRALSSVLKLYQHASIVIGIAEGKEFKIDNCLPSPENLKLFRCILEGLLELLLDNSTDIEVSTEYDSTDESRDEEQALEHGSNRDNVEAEMTDEAHDDRNSEDQETVH